MKLNGRKMSGCRDESESQVELAERMQDIGDTVKANKLLLGLN